MADPRIVMKKARSLRPSPVPPRCLSLSLSLLSFALVSQLALRAIISSSPAPIAAIKGKRILRGARTHAHSSPSLPLTRVCHFLHAGFVGHYYEASVLMPRQGGLIRLRLSKKITGNRLLLSFKDCPRDLSLGGRPSARPRSKIGTTLSGKCLFISLTMEIQFF